MKRISALAMIVVGAIATCVGAVAQKPAIKANIPFNFTVGNTWMPAGEYTVTSPMHSVVQLRSTDLTKIATIVSSQSYNESDSGSELVFDKYGDQYFLHRVLCPSISSLNLDVPQGKAEKKARSRSLEAKLRNGDETLVAVK
jgi:hypothetical protein